MAEVGGTGLIAKKVVKNLRQRHQEVVAASPSTGVNTVTCEGLGGAVAGAQVVIDVLVAEATGGVGHHVALSVVGTDRLLASVVRRR
jgi:uncharacterized protein YbjT (DUF2867 family)